MKFLSIIMRILTIAAPFVTELVASGTITATSVVSAAAVAAAHAQKQPAFLGKAGIQQ